MNIQNQLSRRQSQSPISTHQVKRIRWAQRRAGLAALEVVMTTAISFVILGFATYATMRLCRYMFSFVGEMVGSPLA